MTGPHPLSVDAQSGVLALLAAAKFCKDDRDEAGFGACWAGDARLERTSNGNALAPLQGRDAIIAFYRRVWASGGHGLGNERETHLAEHPHIAVLAPRRLLARHGAAFFNWRGDGPQLVGFGGFRDEIVHSGGPGGLPCASQP